MQFWKKKGLVVPYTSDLIDTVSHCQNPLPFFIKPNLLKIYFGTRNLNNHSRIYSCDFCLQECRVISFSETAHIKPFLNFEKHGMYPACVYRINEEPHMIYVGFVDLGYGKYKTALGIARVKSDGGLVRLKSGLLFSTSEYDPCLVTSPFVIFENELYRMWYVSGYKFENNLDGSWQSYYHIKYAESIDGINWKREGLISIDHVHPGETNIARPWIIKKDGIYKAWFSYSCGKQGYRIGYAESRDGGYIFKRMDHLVVGMHPSNEPWENAAIAYPAVVVHNGKKYMFYNGNKFGKDGIALAVEE